MKTNWLFSNLSGLLYSQQNGLRYIKQILYAGTFFKNGEKVVVSVKDLDTIAASTNAMICNGVKPTLPIDHTEHTLANRGELEVVWRAKDFLGRESLYCWLKFANAKAAQLVGSTDVSVYVPVKWQDGKGNWYYRPIRHLALTSQPLIPGLDNFTPLIASSTMTMMELASKLGLQIPEGADDAAVSTIILNAFMKLAEKLKGGGGGDDGDGDEPIEASAASVQLLADNRTMKIDALVASLKIVPAVAEELKKTWCTNEACALAFSNDTANASFQSVLDALDKNDTITLQNDGTSGPQVLKLSHDQLTDPKHNPLAAAMQELNGN